jgi:hypothetical protein
MRSSLGTVLEEAVSFGSFLLIRTGPQGMGINVVPPPILKINYAAMAAIDGHDSADQLGKPVPRWLVFIYRNILICPNLLEFIPV